MHDNARPLERMVHPGSGRRKPPVFNKGRQLDDRAFEEVRQLLGDRPLRRDLLIEHLHLVQDHFGCLSGRTSRRWARTWELAMAEVSRSPRSTPISTCSRGTSAPPSALTVGVCEALSFGGGDASDETLPSGRPRVRVIRAPCIGRCEQAPAAMVGQRASRPATLEAASRT